MTKNLASISTLPTLSAGSKVDLLEPNYTADDRALVEELRSRMNVGNALFDARAALGLSQAQLAALAQTKQSRVSEIESTHGNVRFDTLDRVSRAAGLMIALVPRAEVTKPRIFATAYICNTSNTLPSAPAGTALLGKWTDLVSSEVIENNYG